MTLIFFTCSLFRKFWGEVEKWKRHFVIRWETLAWTWRYHVVYLSAGLLKAKCRDTLYLLFVLFSPLSRLHRNNANNPITPFSGWTNKLASHHEGLWNPLPYLDSSIGGSGQLGLSDVVMTKWRFRFLITETRRKKGRKAHIRGWCGRSKEKIRQRASKREADWRTLL